MKEHIPTVAIFGSLAMILLTIVVLCRSGVKPDGPVLLGLVGGAGTAVGILGGFSQNKISGKGPNEEQAATPPKDTTK